MKNFPGGDRKEGRESICGAGDEAWRRSGRRERNLKKIWDWTEREKNERACNQLEGKRKQPRSGKELDQNSE